MTVDLRGQKISNSKAKTYRRCPKRYRYKYVDKLEPRKKKIHLERGTWLHALLMHHYDGQDWELHHRRLSTLFYEETFQEQIDEFGDLPNDVKRLMKAYVNRYRAEDRHWTVVDSEVDEYITLPNGLKFNFIIDLIVEEAGYLWLVDHRGIKSFMRSDVMRRDPQLSRYFYGAKKLGYSPLGGVIFNQIRTKPPAVPLVLQSGRLSQRMNIDTDIHTYYRAIRQLRQDPASYSQILQHLARQQDKFFERSRLPKDRALMRNTMRDLIETAQEIQIAEQVQRFPRTIDKSCEWECDFRDVCMVEYLGGDPSSVVRMNFRQRRRPED